MTRHSYIWIVAGLLWIQPAGAQPGGCEAWGEARRIGELARIIDEASGVEASRRYLGHFYHVDDSSTSIHLTDSAGGAAQVVRVSGLRGVDFQLLYGLRSPPTDSASPESVMDSVPQFPWPSPLPAPPHPFHPG